MSETTGVTKSEVERVYLYSHLQKFWKLRSTKENVFRGTLFTRLLSRLLRKVSVLCSVQIVEHLACTSTKISSYLYPLKKIPESYISFMRILTSNREIILHFRDRDGDSLKKKIKTWRKYLNVNFITRNISRASITCVFLLSSLRRIIGAWESSTIRQFAICWRTFARPGVWSWRFVLREFASRK